jgi:hypothetical protein
MLQGVDEVFEFKQIKDPVLTHKMLFVGKGLKEEWLDGRLKDCFVN